MEERSRVIIKKVKKKGHEGHHGGSWKVAYADFVTALMAFFLLLWLLSMISPEKRIALSEYFSSFSLLQDQPQQSGTSVLDRSSGVLEMGKTVKKESYRISSDDPASPGSIVRKMRAAINEKLQAMQNQVFVDTTKEGVRVQIVDNEGSEIFELGSDQPTTKAIEIIKVVSDTIRDKPNRIVIEGHTDSAPFKTAQITNWELSTSRASAARRELEKNGIDPDRIAKVVGYADKDLFIKENPRDLRNRRISFILLKPEEGE
ncbi:MAG: OmpA family protein [Deltaproteobacteria bacterium]|nr:OmpA family protein [Deltaproteobacteria bacterium]